MAKNGSQRLEEDILEAQFHSTITNIDLHGKNEQRDKVDLAKSHVLYPFLSWRIRPTTAKARSAKDARMKYKGWLSPVTPM